MIICDFHLDTYIDLFINRIEMMNILESIYMKMFYPLKSISTFFEINTEAFQLWISFDNFSTMANHNGLTVNLFVNRNLLIHRKILWLVQKVIPLFSTDSTNLYQSVHHGAPRWSDRKSERKIFNLSNWTRNIFRFYSKMQFYSSNSKKHLWGFERWWRNSTKFKRCLQNWSIHQK